MITKPVSLTDADGVRHLFTGCPQALKPVTAAVAQKGQRQCCTWCLLHAGSALRPFQTVAA